MIFYFIGCAQSFAGMHPTIMHPGAFWVHAGCKVCLYQFASEGGNLSCLVFMDGTIQGEENQLFSSISWTKVFKLNLDFEQHT